MAGFKLPFVVEPPKPVGTKVIGNEKTGTLRIPIKGYLTTGEKSFAQQALSGDDGTLKMIAVSRSISRDKNIPLDEAYSMVTRLLAGESDGALRELHAEYNDQLSEILTSLSLMADKEKLVAATILLRYRVDPRVDFEYVMSEIHPDLVEELHATFQAESEGDASILGESEQAETEKPTVNEIEKKPSRRRKTNTETE